MTAAVSAEPAPTTPAAPEAAAPEIATPAAPEAAAPQATTPAAPEAAAPQAATPKPVAIRPAKSFKVFDGTGLPSPRDAVMALAVAPPVAASVATAPQAPAPAATAAFETAPKAAPPVNSGWPANKLAPSAHPAALPPGAAPTSRASATSGNGHGDAWSRVTGADGPGELTFAVHGEIVDSAPAAAPAFAPGETRAPASGARVAPPLAFHVDAATAVAPLTVEPPGAPPAGGDGDGVGGRGWGVREQRPSPISEWHIPQAPPHQSPGAPAIGVPRVQPAARPAASTSLPRPVIPPLQPNREGTLRVLRVGALVLLTLIVIFGVLIYFAGR